MSRVLALLLALTLAGCASMGSGPSIKEEPVTYRDGETTMNGYIVYDEARQGRRPGVIVVHEWWGITKHVRDEARNLARQGYTAFVADMYGDGKTADNPKDAGALSGAVRKNPRAQQSRFNAARTTLARHSTVDANRIGAVGFCFGGGVVNAMAVRFPDLAASVPYYGAQPAADDVAKIKAPLLIHYASEDPNINKGWPGFETALKANKVRYEMHMYPNTQHGFHNDTTPRYDEAAAKLSWQRTVDFFNRNVRT